MRNIGARKVGFRRSKVTQMSYLVPFKLRYLLCAVFGGLDVNFT